MRIEGPRSSSGVTSSRKSPASGSSSGFEVALVKSENVERATTLAPSTQLNSVAALMALQGVDDPTERKRRVERRGRQLLNGLDQLKLDLLEDRDPLPGLQKLKSLLDSAREDSGDSYLESLIDQVELRVEVELAKRLRR